MMISAHFVAPVLYDKRREKIKKAKLKYFAFFFNNFQFSSKNVQMPGAEVE